MTKTAAIITVIILTAVLTAHVSADTGVKRYLFSVGANNGGNDRILLRYAVTDANAFAAVLTEMGGVEKNSAIVIADPSKRELLSGLANLGKLIARDKTAKPNVRSEVFIYYSGHADGSGLKFNGETFLWADFRSAVDGLGADVRVAVVDACGSGAITRTKGGGSSPAFFVDASSNIKGYAFLASSNDKEMSQESDHIKSSYFTYALLNGMRGAADMTGDGKITINEAYVYAFNETLQNTQNTRAGTQHPSRDMSLAGTGDVVMTDLRQTSAKLSLDPNLEGRLFIRNRQGNLFAELYKTRGRVITIGMPPGVYSVQMEAPSQKWMTGDVTVDSGKNTVLALNNMKAMDSRKEGVLVRGDGGANADTSRNIWRGMIDFIGRGIYDLTYYADACGDMGLSLRMGAPWLNAVIEYQQPFGGYDKWPKAWGFGVGTRFGISEAFYLNVDALWEWANYYAEAEDRDTTIFVGDSLSSSPIPIPKVVHVKSSFCSSDGLAKLQFGGNYRFLPYMSVNAGITVNALFEELYRRKERERDDGIMERIEQTFNTGTLWGDYTIGDNEQKMRLWPSFYVGLTVGIPTPQKPPKP